MENFDLIKIRNQWNLLGFRNFKTSTVGQRHDCIVILKDEDNLTYRGSLYLKGRIVIFSPELAYDRAISLEEISKIMLFYRDLGWLPMRKKDLEKIFCGYNANNCIII